MVSIFFSTLVSMFVRNLFGWTLTNARNLETDQSHCSAHFFILAIIILQAISENRIAKKTIDKMIHCTSGRYPEPRSQNRQIGQP